MIPLVLDHNLRNTRQIAQTFVPLAPTAWSCAAGWAAGDVRPGRQDAALAVADEQVDVLFDEGWDAADIALITLGQRHRSRSSGRRPSAAGYWEQFWDTDDLLRPRAGLQGDGAAGGRAVRE